MWFLQAPMLRWLLAKLPIRSRVIAHLVEGSAVAIWRDMIFRPSPISCMLVKLRSVRVANSLGSRCFNISFELGLQSSHLQKGFNMLLRFDRLFFLVLMIAMSGSSKPSPLRRQTANSNNSCKESWNTQRCPRRARSFRYRQDRSELARAQLNEHGECLECSYHREIPAAKYGLSACR